MLRTNIKHRGDKQSNI